MRTPSMSKPPFSAAALTSASTPTRMGVRKPSFFRRAVASRIRASGPSVNTMVRGLAFSVSISFANIVHYLHKCKTFRLVYALTDLF